MLNLLLSPARDLTAVAKAVKVAVLVVFLAISSIDCRDPVTRRAMLLGQIYGDINQLNNTAFTALVDER